MSFALQFADFSHVIAQLQKTHWDSLLYEGTLGKLTTEASVIIDATLVK